MTQDTVISFKKKGYDPFIDFLKAYSIFMVVLAHCLPVALYDYSLFWVWGSMQVPMFVLIQTFHAYKKGTAPRINFLKMLKRIIIPFFLVQAFIFLVLAIMSSESIDSLLLEMVLGGGKGPGSYYFWVYFQIALLLPVFWIYIVRLPRFVLLLVFVGISVGFEFMFSVIDFPDKIYRLLAVRYLFLIFLAYQIWLKDGIKINLKTITLSVLSIFFVLLFTFAYNDYEPLFFNTAWKIHRWICYYYVATLMVFALWYFYKVIGKVEWLNNLALIIGRCSYEIYLMQMIVFVFISSGMYKFIGNPYLSVFMYMITTVFLSIVLGIFLKKYVIDRLLFRTKEIGK